MEEQRIFIRLAQKVKWLRGQKGLTTNELAAELGIGSGTISNIENKKDTKISTLNKIVDYFSSGDNSISVDWLIGRTEAYSADEKMRFACDYTGLNQAAIEFLHIFNDDAVTKRINEFIETIILQASRDESFAKNLNDLSINKKRLFEYVKECYDAKPKRQGGDSVFFENTDEAMSFLANQQREGQNGYNPTMFTKLNEKELKARNEESEKLEYLQFKINKTLSSCLENYSVKDCDCSLSEYRETMQNNNYIITA